MPKCRAYIHSLPGCLMMISVIHLGLAVPIGRSPARWPIKMSLAQRPTATATSPSADAYRLCPRPFLRLRPFPTPTATETPSATPTAMPTPVPTPTSVPTPTPMPVPTATATPTATPTPTSTPTAEEMELAALTRPPEHMVYAWWDWDYGNAQRDHESALGQITVDVEIHNDIELAGRNGIYLMVCSGDVRASATISVCRQRA